MIRPIAFDNLLFVQEFGENPYQNISLGIQSMAKFGFLKFFFVLNILCKNALSDCSLNTFAFENTRIKCSSDPIEESNESSVFFKKHTACVFTCIDNPKRYVARCQNDGNWDLDLSTVQCELFVRCKDPSIEWPLWSWEQCTYYYNQGSVCYGSCQSNVTVKSKIRCLQNGIWQHSETAAAESCNSTSANCQNPTELWNNWNWNCSSKDELNPGSVCNGTCSHYSNNTDTTIQIRCSEDGTWDYQPELENCQLVCDSDWIQINGTCFHFETELKSFYAAAEHCKSIGGQLYEPKDLITNNLVFETAVTQFNLDEALTFYAWIGLHSPLNDSSAFVLLSNGEVPSFYNWGPGEPNDVGHDEYCVEFRLYANTRIENWNDFSCTTQSRSVCEKI